MTVTVYTKPSCVQCNATYRALDSKGIEYEVLDLSEDESARTRSMESATGLQYINVGSILAGTIVAAGLYFGAGLLV